MRCLEINYKLALQVYRYGTVSNVVNMYTQERLKVGDNFSERRKIFVFVHRKTCFASFVTTTESDRLSATGPKNWAHYRHPPPRPRRRFRPSPHRHAVISTRQNQGKITYASKKIVFVTTFYNLFALLQCLKCIPALLSYHYSASLHAVMNNTNYDYHWANFLYNIQDN